MHTYNIFMLFKYRITEWFGLEGPINIISFQHPAGTPSTGQVAQSPIQPERF